MSADLFLKQASAAVQLVNALMVKDVIALAPAWGYLQTDIRLLDDKDFSNPAASSAGREKLTKDFDGIFALVEAGDYKQVLSQLPTMSADADKLLTGKPDGNREGRDRAGRENGRARRGLEHRRDRTGRKLAPCGPRGKCKGPTRRPALWC